MDRQTLRDWVHRFNLSGREGLIDTHRARPACRPSNWPSWRDRRDWPGPWKDGVVRWRRIDLKRVIAERFGVDFHPRYVGKLLHKLASRT